MTKQTNKGRRQMSATTTVRSAKSATAIATVIALLATMLYALAALGGSSPAGAEFPSGKATVNVTDLTLIEETEAQAWTTVLSSTIKPPGGNQALFIDVSLMCGLYTQTQVQSKGGNKDTSSAEGTVTVRVLLNGDEAHPGEVVFCNRYQELSAELQGIIDVVDGSVVVTDYETIELIQRTMSANAFNFIADGLDPSTVYQIEVQALVGTDTDSGNGSASAAASVGKGSVTVDAVRLVKGDEVLTTE